MEIEIKFIRDNSQLPSRDLATMTIVTSTLEDLLTQSDAESTLAVRIISKTDAGIKLPNRLGA